MNYYIKVHFVIRFMHEYMLRESHFENIKKM